MAFGTRLESTQPSLRSKQEGIIAKPASIYKSSDLRQTRAKIKNGPQVLNFLSLVKFVVFFMICNLLTLCNAACPGAANVSSQLTSNIANTPNAQSNKLATRGYSLTQSKLWKFYAPVDSEYIQGIELTFSSDCCGDPDIVQMYGITSNFAQTVAITKKVTQVQFRAGVNLKLSDIWFTHFDGSITKTSNCLTCTAVGSITLTGNLIGLATKTFDGVQFQLEGKTSDMSVWVDSIAQCSGCPTFFSFPQTIASRTYAVSQPAVTTEAFSVSILPGLLINCQTPTFIVQKGTVTTYASQSSWNVVPLPTWLTNTAASSTYSYNIPMDNNQISVYTITVIGSGTNFSFDINVLSSCTVAVLTINDLIFLPTSSYTMTQQIWASKQTMTWSTTGITTIVTVKDLNNNLITICLPLVFEFLDPGSIPVVTSSEFEFNLNTKNFSMQTNLPAKTGDWFYKIKYTLQNFPTATAGIKDFKVRFQNLCEPPTSIVPSIVQTQTYQLTYAAALQFTPGPFVVNPSYCPLTYQFAISPVISDANAVVLNTTTRQFTVQSNDLSLAGTYLITYTAYSPASVALTPVLSFSLILANPCLAATLTIAPTIIAAATTYTLADPLFSFPVLDLTKITNNKPSATCPALLVDLFTSTNGAFDSSVFTFSANVLQVYSTDSSKIKTYNLQLRVKYTGAIYSYAGSLLFNVNVAASCTTAALTIDDTKFKADTLGFTMIQSIWQLSSSLTWTDSIVTVKDVLGNLMSCGSLVYEFQDSSSTPFASTSEISYNLSTKTFSMQTNLPTSAGTTPLKLKVTLQSWAMVPPAIKNFEVQFINSCEPPALITPSIGTDKTYNLTYATALSFTVGAFAVSPTYCPITYSFSIWPPISDLTVVVFNATTRAFTVQSNDLSLAGTYAITVTALSPASVALTPTLGFSLILVDPCTLMTLTIAPTIIAAATTYTLTDPEYSFPVLDLTKITNNNALATCPALQVDLFTSLDGPVNPDIFTFPSNVLKVYSTDYANISTFNMKFKVQYTGASYSYTGSLSFAVNIVASCITATLTIDDTKFTSADLGFTMTQSIWQPITTLTWTDTIVAVKDVNNNVMNYCGSLVYEFLNSDSTPFVPTSEISYNLSTKTFSMQTNLPASVAETSLKLKVTLLSWATVAAAIKDFKVQFINSCETPISTTPPIVPTKNYSLTHATPLQFAVVFTVNPTYCPIYYSFDISPTISPASVVTFNTSTGTFAVQSNDLSIAGTYTIIVIAYSPAGTVLTQTSNISLNLLNPCLTATFTINPSIIAATTIYTVNFPQISLPVLDRTKISPSDLLATCPALQVDILTSTDGPIDSSLFTFASDILQVYSTDTLKISPYNYKIRVKYIGAIYSYAGSLSFTVNALAQTCAQAWMVPPASQTNPLPYLYSGYPENFYFAPFTITPSNCVPVFSCAIVTSPPSSLNLCAVSNGLSKSTFDTTNGNYSFTSRDFVTYKPGTYTFQITITIEAQSKTQNFVLVLVDPCDSPIEIIKKSKPNPPPYLYTSEKLNYEIALFDANDSRCPVTYSCFSITHPTSTGLNCNSSQIKWSNAFKVFEFTTADLGVLPGNYTVTYEGIIGNVNKLKSNNTFVLQLVNPCPTLPFFLQKSPFIDQTYFTGSDEIKLQWDDSQLATLSSLLNCGPFMITQFWTQDNSGKHPLNAKIFQVDFTTLTFTIKAEDNISLVGIYKVYYEVSLQNYATAKRSQINPLTVKCEAQPIPPVPTPLVLSDQSFGCDAWTFKLPAFVDMYGKPQTVSVNLGSASDILEFDESQNMIRTKFDVKVEGKGTFELTVYLIDSKQKLDSASFMVQYSCTRKSNSTEVMDPINTSFNGFKGYVPQKKTSNAPAKPPTTVLKFINNFGTLRIGFSREIVIPSFSTYPEFLDKKLDLLRNCTNGNTCNNQTNRILADLNQQEQAVDIINKGQLKINNTLFPVMDIVLLPSQYEDARKLNFTWECQNFTSNYIDVKVDFEDKNAVSINTIRDEIKVIFYANNLIRTPDNQVLSMDNIFLIVDLPPQQDQNNQAVAAMKSFANSCEKTGKASLILMWFISLTSQGLLDQVFGVIQKFQIMVHLTLISIATPANASSFFSKLLGFVSFDLIPQIQTIQTRVLTLNNAPFTDQFNELGYQSSYFVINMGTMMFVFYLYVFLFVLIGITFWIKNETVQKYRTKLKQKMMFSTSLNFFNEGYLLMSISCFIELAKMQHSTYAEKISLALAFIFLIVIIGLPLFYLIALQTYKQDVRTEKFIKLYGDFCEKYRYKRFDRLMLLESFISVLRRLLTALTLVFMINQPILALFSMYYQMILVTVYNGQVQPFGEFGDYLIEQISEVFIGLLIYHMFCFTSMVSDPGAREILGWSMVASMSLILITSFAYLGKLGISSLIRFVRLRLVRRKRLAEAKKAAELRQIEGEKPEVLEEVEEVKQNQVIEQANELQFEDQKDSKSIEESQDSSQWNFDLNFVEESKDSEQINSSEESRYVTQSAVSNETLCQYLEFDSDNPIATVREPIMPDLQLQSPKSNDEYEIVVPPLKRMQDKNDRATNCIALIENAEERNVILLRNRGLEIDEETKVTYKQNKQSRGSLSIALDDISEDLRREESTYFQNFLNPDQEEDIDDLFIHNKTNGNQLFFFPGMPFQPNSQKIIESEQVENARPKTIARLLQVQHQQNRSNQIAADSVNQVKPTLIIGPTSLLEKKKEKMDIWFAGN